MVALMAKIDPTFEIVTMTPEWALDLLANNIHQNRKIKRNHVKKLTQIIEKGDWQVTAQGIALDSDDNVLDGQHRLEAVIQAEKPIQIMLGRNLSPSIFNVVDIGSKRTAGDALEIMGSTKGRTIAVALKNYQLYYQFPKVKWTGHHTPQHSEITKLYEIHRDFIEKMVVQVGERRKHYRCFLESVALTFSMLARDRHWSESYVLDFFDAICYGANLNPDNVCLFFRNQLGSGNLRRRGINNTQYSLNALIKCFNTYAQKVPVAKFIAPYPNTEMYVIVDAKKVHSHIIEVISKDD